MIESRSRLRTAWDTAAAVLCVLTCLLVPYQVAFTHRVRPTGSALLYLLDLFFLVDILLNFATSYRARGHEVRARREIARHYLRTLFFVDLLGCVPFDALLLGWRDVTLGGVSIVLVARLPRLLRVVRLLVIFRRWERQSWTNSGTLRIVKFGAVVLLLLHWLACAWFLVPFLEGVPDASWIAREGLRDAPPAVRYLRALYWTVVTMTTVGYGDITPRRTVEYVFAIGVMLMGATLYTYIIGNIASLFSNLDASKAAFWSRVDAVNQYLHARRVPRELNDQVRDYYDYVWWRHRGASEHDLLNDLPPPVRLEIMVQLTRELTQCVPLFRHCSPALRNVLLLALTPQVYVPGSLIVREGEVGSELYYLCAGRAEILSDDGRRSHGTLEAGDHFGTLSLLLGERRTGSVKALTFCDVFVLSREDFERVKRDYAEFREVLARVSEEKSDRMTQLLLEGVVL